MNMKKRMFLALVATATCCTVGCESFMTGSAASKKKKKDSGSWFSFKKKEYQIPQSMNVTWSNDILTLAGKPPTRGFGGRFFFYNEKNQAIPVDGDLVVYGFDDTFTKHDSEDLGQADKRFRFTSEQFTTHFSESELGASYSVWIPWDEAYGDKKKIMLLPTFMTKDGRLVRGAAANLNLPGKSSEDPSFGMAQQASSTIPTTLPSQLKDPRSGPNSEVLNGMRTTTIQLPTNSLRRAASPTAMSPEIADALARQTQSLQNQLPAPMLPPNTSFANQAPSQANFDGAQAGGIPMLNANVHSNAAQNQFRGPMNTVTPFDRSNQAMAQHLSTLPFNPTGGAASASVASGSGLAGQTPFLNQGGPLNHSAPGSPQAPVLQAAQPAFYPIR